MPAPFQPPACDPYGKWPQADSYGYKPSLAAGIVFSILFGLLSVTQLLQAIRFRSFWLLALFFVAGCGLECLGWIGRTIQSKCVYGHELFVMQVATLIMGPAWVQGGIYVTLWCYITILGRACSPVPPKIYLWSAFWFDCVALGLQAAGGGLAGTAYDKGQSTQTATTIMVIGIIAQLAGGVAFSTVLSIVIWRAAAKIRSQRLLIMFAIAMTIAMAMMITRGVYRTIELLQGWRGYLITTQAYIIALDAVPMVIAFGALTIVNPAKIWSQKEQLQEALGTSAAPNEKLADLESGNESEVRMPNESSGTPKV